jgi:ribosome-associated toxin RatA of RatAB toxin-antitoxin module
MSVTRSQALIEAPPERIWELVGDPRRHPEWWPRVIEVRGEEFEEGDNFAQVTRDPGGASETTMAIERLDDLRAIHLRCTNTGTYSRWLLTEAQGDTFVDVEFGIDPANVRYRIFDVAFGKLYFRRWLSQSLDALQKAASEAQPGRREPVE